MVRRSRLARPRARAVITLCVSFASALASELKAANDHHNATTNSNSSNSSNGNSSSDPLDSLKLYTVSDVQDECRKTWGCTIGAFVGAYVGIVLCLFLVMAPIIALQAAAFLNRFRLGPALREDVTYTPIGEF